MTALADPPVQPPASTGPARSRGGSRRSGAGRTMRGGRLAHAILVLAVLVSAFPFYWTIVAASRSNAELAQVPPTLLPGPNLMRNFEAVVKEADIGKALVNSFIVSGSITLGTVLCSTLAGFAFAKLRFRGRGALLALTVGTMMIPPQLGVIPLFMLMAHFMVRGRVVDDLYATAHTLLRHVRGGLGIATVAACTVFAAISGSSVATALTVGKVAIPQMLRYGYSRKGAFGGPLSRSGFILDLIDAPWSARRKKRRVMGRS